jgi:hypothetical protein
MATFKKAISCLATYEPKSVDDRNMTTLTIGCSLSIAVLGVFLSPSDTQPSLPLVRKFETNRREPNNDNDVVNEFRATTKRFERSSKKDRPSVLRSGRMRAPAGDQDLAATKGGATRRVRADR